MPEPMTLLSLVEALSCGRQGCACRRRFGSNLSTHCPCHPDDKPSLSVKEEGGKVLLRCHGGCSNAEVIAALQARDLWQPEREGPPDTLARKQTPSRARRIAQTYDYTDEAGVMLFQAVRYEPKGFSQRRPAQNGTWIYSLNECPPRLVPPAGSHGGFGGGQDRLGGRGREGRRRPARSGGRGDV